MSTLGGNQDGTLGGTAAIKHYSLCALQEGNFLYLRRQYVIGLTGYTVDQNQLVREAPHTCTVETGYIALHVVKAVGIVVLVRQISIVQTGDTAHDVFLGHLAECHVDQGRVCCVNLR